MNPLRGRSITAVVADMDGLLLDTERIVRTGWQRAAREVGLALDDALYAELLGLTQPDVVVRLGAAFGPGLGRGRFSGPGARLHAGAAHGSRGAAATGRRSAHRPAARHGIRRAIATSTARHEARPRLEQSGLWAAFDAVVCGDEVSRGKPAPDIYLSAAAAIGAPPGECLALEDSDTGARAAIAAGMIVVMVPDLGAPAAQTRAACAAVARSLDEVATWLARSWLRSGRDHADQPGVVVGELHWQELARVEGEVLGGHDVLDVAVALAIPGGRNAVLDVGAAVRTRG